MLPLTLAEVAAACGGTLERGDAETVVRAVCTDTRCLEAGDLFVGLRGENFDGDAYAAAALAAGAAAVVVRGGAAAGLPSTAARVVVDDGLVALQRLAAHVRRRAGARVVAITGSAGKTSTKDILAALLRPVARTVATSANLNNEIGVPLTLLEIDETTEVVVVEMAMRGAGQIRELAQIAAPDVGVITTIAPVHLELVGTIEEVAAAKAELIEELRGGTAVVPAGETLLDRHVGRHHGRVVTFGREDADVHIVEAERRGAEHARARRCLRPSRHGSTSASPAGTTCRTRWPRSRPSSSSDTASTRRGRAPPRSPSATSAAPCPSCPAAACCSTTPTTPTRRP